MIETTIAAPAKPKSPFHDPSLVPFGVEAEPQKKEMTKFNAKAITPKYQWEREAKKIDDAMLQTSPKTGMPRSTNIFNPPVSN